MPSAKQGCQQLSRIPVTADRFDERLCGTGREVHFAALCADEGADAGERYARALASELLLDDAGAHAALAFGTGRFISRRWPSGSVARLSPPRTFESDSEWSWEFRASGTDLGPQIRRLLANTTRTRHWSHAGMFTIEYAEGVAEDIASLTAYRPKAILDAIEGRRKTLPALVPP